MAGSQSHKAVANGAYGESSKDGRFGTGPETGKSPFVSVKGKVVVAYPRSRVSPEQAGGRNGVRRHAPAGARPASRAVVDGGHRDHTATLAGAPPCRHRPQGGPYPAAADLGRRRRARGHGAPEVP